MNKSIWMGSKSDITWMHWVGLYVCSSMVFVSFNIISFKLPRRQFSNVNQSWLVPQLPPKIRCILQLLGKVFSWQSFNRREIVKSSQIMHVMNQLRRLKQADSCANPRMEWMERHSQASSLWERTMNYKRGIKGKLKSMTAVAKKELSFIW